MIKNAKRVSKGRRFELLVLVSLAFYTDVQLIESNDYWVPFDTLKKAEGDDLLLSYFDTKMNHAPLAPQISIMSPKECPLYNFV
jgi:hypothetical protein